MVKIIDDIKVLIGDQDGKKIEIQPPKKVLIVEDEKPLADILETRLKEEGFEVIKAVNGEEGLKILIKFNPNVILLDLMMPVMDGRVMLRKLRDMPKFRHLPVIVLTNAGETDNIRETQRYSDAVYFLIKSNVTMDKIVETIKSITW